MRRLALIVMLCLISGIAHGTFEHQDPAEKVIEDLKNDSEGESLPAGDGIDSFAEWNSKSVGSTTCSKYLSYRQERSISYWSSLYWLQGFINGAGYQRYMTLDDSRLITYHNTESMALWIENHCSENPSNNLAEAAAAFVEEYLAEEF